MDISLVNRSLSIPGPDLLMVFDILHNLHVDVTIWKKKKTTTAPFWLWVWWSYGECRKEWMYISSKDVSFCMSFLVLFTVARFCICEYFYFYEYLLYLYCLSKWIVYRWCHLSAIRIISLRPCKNFYLITFSFWDYKIIVSSPLPFPHSQSSIIPLLVLFKIHDLCFH